MVLFARTLLSPFRFTAAFFVAALFAFGLGIQSGHAAKHLSPEMLPADTHRARSHQDFHPKKARPAHAATSLTLRRRGGRENTLDTHDFCPFTTLSLPRPTFCNRIMPQDADTVILGAARFVERSTPPRAPPA